ncbi:uncharacterized protein METZ01_LOCUS44392, partial [marine metagenome]
FFPTARPYFSDYRFSSYRGIASTWAHEINQVAIWLDITNPQDDLGESPG